MPKISICYVTGRRAPQWRWFVDSLAAQTTPEQRANLQLVFIDGYAWAPGLREAFKDNAAADHILLGAGIYHDAGRIDELAGIVAGRFSFIHVPPKPCAWQGPFRQTTK